MREKYESLSLAVLKELAKARGLKGVSALRKPDLIERMLEEDAKEKNTDNKPYSKQMKEQVRSTEQAKPAEQNKSTDQSRTTESTQAKQTYRTRSQYQSQEQNGTQQRTRFRTSQYQPRNEQSTQTTPQVRSERTQFQYQPKSVQVHSQSEVQSGIQSETADKIPTYIPPTRVTPTQAVPTQEVPTELTSEQVSPTYTAPIESTSSQVSQTNPLPPGTYILPKTEAAPYQEKIELDSGEKANGILEVMPDGYGFIRCENYLPGENDVYVSPSQIRRFNMKTGDIIQGNVRIKTQGEKFSALLYVSSLNGFHPSEGQRRCNFEDMTPIFPNERLILERAGGTTAMRIVDLISPIGKGQRGMIVSPPKAGKTTLLKDVAKSLLRNDPETHLIILLIDERPEEVTDIKEAIYGKNVEVIYSTFDETPEHHKRVSEMVMERAKRLVEHKKDVVILLDSITRLARAYNLIIPPSGRTLSGGLDPAALHMPKRFFGAARNMREGGSLTILATALVDTGSKMDDVIYEEFKGTGNMELVLDRKLQERRVFPAIDIQKSGTRREDLLLTREEQEAVYNMRRALNSLKSDEAVEQILNMFSKTQNNDEFVQTAKKQKFQ